MTAQSPLGRYREAVFFASGFAGLIYESIWTHYLKLFLGHAAYAQTLVLAIFMGGMAIGAAGAARYTASIRHPLRTYAFIEAAIGLLAIAFHPVFIGATNGFFDVAFARHFGGAPFAIGKWGLATLLILPQSILLGATFPVFATAATRDAPVAKGRPIATLYFANSLGGAIGVLASGFLLIPSVGLWGTISAAGAVNLAIAALVLWMANAAARSRATASPTVELAPAKPAPALSRKANNASAKRGTSTRVAGKRAAGKPSAQTPMPPVTATSIDVIAVAPALLLAASLLTGAASFIYEIAWIRMLSLVLGSATHSFELMLSSFILGLALGGLWIRSRIDTASNPGMLLAYIQIAMGCAALATVPLHSASFDLFAFVVTQAPKTEAGYAVFNLVRYGIASLIMFPAAFCAGMTLPLVTRILYAQKGQGEKAIGSVYSANTIGAIIGLGLAIHIGLPVFGLEYLVASGAVIDVLLGAALLVAFGGRRSVKYAIVAGIACGVGTVAVATTFDPRKMSSGVFRSGKASVSGTVLEVAHGKTATITVDADGGFITIRTNGKADAAAHLGWPQYTADQVTMTLSGAIPLMLHRDPQRVANIGLGSGITGETILSDPRVRHLDTVEIEPRMVDLARRFGDLNRSVYEDPRSTIHIEDAKSFFATNGKSYDLIISEPSNPWVSGVSGLFSVEFYRHVSRYLNDDGLFAQWLQTYETDPDRAMSVLKAVDQAFEDYLVVALVEGDVLIIAKPHGKVVMPEDAFARMSAKTRGLLRHLDVANQSDVTFRIIGNKALFKPFLDTRQVPANTDFFPYLDSNADRDRFLDHRWPDLAGVALSAYPIAETLGGRPSLATPSALSITSHFGLDPIWLPARLVKESLLGPASGANSIPIPANLPEQLASQGDLILDFCRSPPRDDRATADAIIGTSVLPYLSPAEGRDVLAALGRSACLDDRAGAQARWRALLNHAADRNAKEFGALADELLASGQTTTDVRARYVLGMAMLGRIAAGDRARARALWDQYGKNALGNAPPGLALEILRAHSLSADRQPERGK